MYDEELSEEDPEDTTEVAAPRAPAAAAPVGALAAMADADPLAGLDPEQLMAGARKFTDPKAVGRARAAGFLKPTQSRHFSANYYNALTAADTAELKQQELMSRYLPVVQRAAQARQQQQAQLTQQQRGLLTTTASSALMDPGLTPESLRQSIDGLVSQGRVPGQMAQRFLASLPTEPAALRRMLTNQAIAATDPYRAVAKPTVEKYRVDEVGYEADPVSGARKEVGRGGTKPTALADALREYMTLPLDTPPAVRKTYQDYITKLTTHQLPAQMIVNPEKPLINSFMDVIGKSLADERGAAQGAKASMETSGRLLEVLKSPNIFTGPGAQAAVAVAQIAELGNFGGKDNRERLANTQLAIQSMAQLELDAASQMKGQGAITENERDILKRVAGGKIQLTKEEIRTLAIVGQRNARIRIERYNKNAQRLSKLKGFEAFGDALLPMLSVGLDDLDSGTLVEYDAQGRAINPGVKK